MNSDQFETGIPAPQGLYDFEQERDACGVGLVCAIDGKPRREIVEMAIKSHRERAMKQMRARAEDAAEDRILDALLPPARWAARPSTGAN